MKLEDTFYSEWGRVDQGGGKFNKEYISEDNIVYKITNEIKEVETWKEEKELKYSSWKDDTQFVPQDNAYVLCINFKFEFK